METVEEELSRTLLGYANVLPATLVEIGKSALSAPGKVLAARVSPTGEADNMLPAAGRWPLFVLLSAQAAEPGCEAWREALPGAVAIEISMAAADLLDELADADPSPIVARYGAGQAMNTANLMLIMAQQTLLRHAKGEGGERALRALDALQEMLVEAAVGQHLDILYGNSEPNEVTLEMSASMTERKAGALVSGACRIGAILAGADERVIELLARFGREIGGIAQLQNDIQDMLPLSSDSADMVPANDQAGYKTDLRLRKRTLPVVFALREESPEPNAIQRAFMTPAQARADEEEMRRAVVDAGGVQFAELIIEVHRQKAVEAIEALEALRPGAREVLGTIIRNA